MNFMKNTKIIFNYNYLLKIFLKLKSVKKIIYASSYPTYDEKYYMKIDMIDYPIDENIRLNPRNLIGGAKLYHEKELELLKNLKRTNKFQF